MSSVAVPEKRTWTYRDYLALDDDQRYEILGGELLMVPAPGLDHQQVSRDFAFLLWQFVKARNLGQVYFAPVDVVLDQHNVVQPDIVFVAKENAIILQKQAIVGSPDLVIEIISPTSGNIDRKRKKSLYARFGVREYWLVDPGLSQIEVVVLVGKRYERVASATGQDEVASRVVPGFVIRVAEVMAISDE